MQTTYKFLVASCFLFATLAVVIGGNGPTHFFPSIHLPTAALLEAVPDSVETNINEAITFNVLANDIGEGIFVNSTFQPIHGTLSWKLNGDFTYTPNENYVGPDIIVYQISDDEGNQESANVFITIKGSPDLPLQMNTLQECDNSTITGTYYVTMQAFGGTPPYLVDFLYGDDLVNLNVSTHLLETYEFLSWAVDLKEGYAITVKDATDHVVAENHLLEIFCHEDVVNTCVLETDFQLTPIVTCNEGEKTIEIVASGGSGEYTYYGQPLSSNGDYIVVEDSNGCQNILFYDDLPAYTCPKAHDDIVNGAYNAPFHLKPLLNDIGEGLYISDIGGLTNGTIQWRPDDFLAYFPDEDFTGIDTIDYEITDIAGNTSRAKILAVVPENDEVEIFWERDCTNAENTGLYEVSFTVAGGKPPYTIGGSLEISDYRGDELLSIIQEDGMQFGFTVTDSDGETITLAPDLPGCTFLYEFPATYEIYISCIEGSEEGIFTAFNSYGESLVSDEGFETGDTIPNGTDLSIQTFIVDKYLQDFIIVEETVYCPPIANNDLYYNHPSYLQFSLTFNPLLDDNGHGMRLVEVESPKYGTLEGWQADGTVSYRPNADFQGVETFDYTLEDIGGNRTQATIKIVMAHPTELQITYERDCSEVIQNGAENYTVNAFVSGGVPPYQVQVNEGEFFELTENGEAFSFEVVNGEGFQIYAEDAGVVIHEAMVEELELVACSELIVELERDCSAYCDGYYYLHVAIFSGTPPFIISGTINDTLETIGFVSTATPLQNDEPYEIYVTDNGGSEFSEVVAGETPCPIFGSCCETLLLETIDEVATCLCDGSMIFHFQALSDTASITDINGYWFDDINGGNIEIGDPIPSNAYLEFYEVSTENGCYHIMIGDETNSVFIDGITSDFCTPETYTLEAQDDFASTSSGESVAIDLFANDSGTDLFIKQIINVSCGEVLEIDSLNGTITYIPYSDTNCQFDTMVYEVEDACRNLTTGSLTIEIASESMELIVEVNRNCTNASETGHYDLHVAINSGVPPYNLSIDIFGIASYDYEFSGNEVISIPQIPDGSIYEVTVEDAAGNWFKETGGAIPCSTSILCEELEITNIEDIFICDCMGNISLDFSSVLSSNENYTLYGVWKTETDTSSSFNNGIPAGASFFIYGINTGDTCYEIAYQGDDVISGFTSDFCTPDTLEAQDDFASTNPGEAVTINVLQNDTGTNLQVLGLLIAPNCGTIMNLNPETGGIIYLPDANTTCAFDSFVYEVVDKCGNVGQATVTIALPPYEPALFVEIERDCIGAENTGVYTVNVDIIAGFPPFTISGSLNETIESLGEFSILIEDGFPYEILITDTEGDEFYEIGGNVSCCKQAIGEITLNESESQTLTCNETENITLSIEGPDSNTYNWYLDELATIPANPPTGQVWVNEEKVGPRIIYLVATYGSLCASDTLPFATYSFDEISTTDLDIEIASSCEAYRVSFGIIGGNSVYTINGSATSNDYMSDWIPIEQEYSFTIDDSPLIPNCEAITISGSVADLDCLPIARDDCVAVEKGEDINIGVLRNDTGKDIQLWDIFPDFNCGEIVEATPETGSIIYYSNFSSDCEEDSFTYEIQDADGNTDQAMVRVLFVEDKEELLVKVESDCSEQYTEGLVEISVWALGGIPPFTISGTINETLEDYGQVSTTIEAGLSYEIYVSDAAGNEFSRIDDRPCCTYYEIVPMLDCFVEGQDTMAVLTYEVTDETGATANPLVYGNAQNDTLSNGEIYELSISGSVECPGPIIMDTIDCDFLPISNTQHPISNIQVYPNPSNGNFTLSLQLKQAEEIDIEILDILGQEKLWQRFPTLPTVERQDFNLNLNLPSGLYFLQVSGKNWRWTEKVIIR